MQLQGFEGQSELWLPGIILSGGREEQDSSQAFEGHFIPREPSRFGALLVLSLSWNH